MGITTNKKEFHFPEAVSRLLNSAAAFAIKAGYYEELAKTNKQQATELIAQDTTMEVEASKAYPFGNGTWTYKQRHNYNVDIGKLLQAIEREQMTVATLLSLVKFGSSEAQELARFVPEAVSQGQPTLYPELKPSPELKKLLRSQLAEEEADNDAIRVTVADAR